MNNYADRLVAAIRSKGNPCVVGLDPRLELIPEFATTGSAGRHDRVRMAITNFHRVVLEVVSPLVPAVKLQIAFYEQYGVPGIYAFKDTILLAKEHGLVVIVDAKRNDISSTAQAYANALLGRSNIWGESEPVFDADCITVSPFLGRDSLIPFIETCAEYGKGLFILVKTSNPGSKDIQDQQLEATGEPLYERLAMLVDELGSHLIGDSGYSSIGAVVGATFPEEARKLRQLMSKSIFLVPGYGVQGATAKDAVACFNPDGLGAVVNASRSITYTHSAHTISYEQFAEAVHKSTTNMISEITRALQQDLSLR